MALLAMSNPPLPSASLDGTVYSRDGITVVQYADRYHYYDREETVRDWTFKSIDEQQEVWERILDFIAERAKAMASGAQAPQTTSIQATSSEAWGGLIKVFQQATRGVVRWKAVFPSCGWSQSFATEDEAVALADTWFNNHAEFQRRKQLEAESSGEDEPAPELITGVFGGGDVDASAL